ncbi:MAG: GNAT family N-acetyltransferase, partial [Amphiplicatus sp.]
VEQGKRRRAGYVELRGAPAPLGGWIVKRGVYAGFEFILPTDESENLNRIPRRRRAEVRKAEAALAAGALNADFDGDEAAFYTLYAEAMRDHGTPVFSRVFLAALMTEFAGRVEILTLRKERAPILALLSFYFGDRVMPYYVGGRGEARALRAYDLAYWLQMRRAALKGAAVFDFGRSKYGSGSFDYKKYWGAEPRPLDYHYALLKARATPNVSPANPRYRAAVSAWRRLPLGLANRAGPVLARHIA